jgi:hypothetical protein
MARMRQLKITKQVTNRDTPSLDKYLQEIGKVKLITAQEEVELGTPYQTRRHHRVGSNWPRRTCVSW